MGFLGCRVNLQGTPFTQEHLDFSRGYWQFLIGKVAPEWLDQPKGHLAVHWQSDTIPSVVHLIDLAKMFYSLIHTITEDSQTTFGSKLRQLLFSDGRQHEEQVTELLVGALLTRLATPLTMEPVGAAVPSSSAAAGTVDYSLEWRGEESIFVESTIFHLQKILDWECAIDDLKMRFEQAMVRRRLKRTLRIAAPLELSRRTLSAQALKTALRRIETSDQGHYALCLGKDRLDLEWAPYPHFKTFAEEEASRSRSFAFSVGNGVEVAMAAATDVALKWPGDAEQLVTKSLRNTLDGKRRQFHLKAPYVLFIRISSTYIPVNGVLDIVSRRIYSNVHYRWISAIVLLSVTAAQNTGLRPLGDVLLNPNASDPLPETFVAALLR